MAPVSPEAVRRSRAYSRTVWSMARRGVPPTPSGADSTPAGQALVHQGLQAVQDVEEEAPGRGSRPGSVPASGAVLSGGAGGGWPSQSMAGAQMASRRVQGRSRRRRRRGAGGGRARSRRAGRSSSPWRRAGSAAGAGAVRAPAVSRRKRSPRRAAICSTESTRARAAASSRASGRPSRRCADLGHGRSVGGRQGEAGAGGATRSRKRRTAGYSARRSGGSPAARVRGRERGHRPARPRPAPRAPPGWWPGCAPRGRRGGWPRRRRRTATTTCSQLSSSSSRRRWRSTPPPSPGASGPAPPGRRGRRRRRPGRDRVGHRGQLHQATPSGNIPPAPPAGGDVQGEAGLARPAGPGQGHQSRRRARGASEQGRAPRRLAPARPGVRGAGRAAAGPGGRHAEGDGCRRRARGPPRAECAGARAGPGPGVGCPARAGSRGRPRRAATSSAGVW